MAKFTRMAPTATRAAGDAGGAGVGGATAAIPKKGCKGTPVFGPRLAGPEASNPLHAGQDVPGPRTRTGPAKRAGVGRGGFVAEGKVEIDSTNMAVFVEGEGLAVLLMEHFGIEVKDHRFFGLERLRITVERTE